MKEDWAGLGLRVGLEVHQQLATGRKLFCGCSQDEPAAYDRSFVRRLRAARGEAGGYDPAAVFEGSKAATMTYRAGPGSSCLVEEDEEPPRGVDGAAMRAALVVASALGSRVFREVFPMRKMVIDGSNTSGFQRTMLVAQGGALRAGGAEVGVQSVCLEEDAARLLEDGGGGRVYGLDRLGVPLVEIALEPVEGGPAEARGAALALGRLLRSTGMAARGLGSIRQDVNVSVRGGAVVEVKGVQQLDQLEKTVEFEAGRQAGLLAIAERVRAAGGGSAGGAADVTDYMAGCGSAKVRGAVEAGHRVVAMRFPGLAGIFGFEPREGVRLGREVAELVRFYGIGGVFHSDELPGYGITGRDVGEIRGRLGAAEGDGFLVIALPERMRAVVEGRVAGRVAAARDGVPAETRMAGRDGRTVFLRPRPGPARMYPETDVPPVAVSDGDLAAAARDAPPPWDELISGLAERHGLNAQLAEQVLDSGRAELLGRICGGGGPPANFVASVLCSTVTSLQRKGLDAGLLDDGMVLEAFGMLRDGKIAKESLEVIFGEIMGGGARSVGEAVEAASIGAVSDGELSDALDKIVAGGMGLIERRGERAAGPLMGRAMAELRGRAPGERISRMLADKIRSASSSKK